MAELHEVDAWLAALLSQLEPAARKKMLREVAHDVRRIQQANITAQRSPDGTAWEPRRVSARSKKGRIRRGMFAKLKTAKYLKIQAATDHSEVSFNGNVQRIAKVHHFGLKERINKRSKIEVRVKVRQLIGLNDQVTNSINDALIAWLSCHRK
ncbi:phage virion morphogenesis protein [Pantoea agglomerans]|uniref:phage virion morphogenesis protein n=1 Tax=Enterobacter agglomerans TaxID=549 RepID=UPI0012ADE9D4|nr:phage virion morphogenesis protein [Pantoea agglomerans]MRT09150.1 phage virion morphogenesis protein [Pantoea agglomerans]